MEGQVIKLVMERVAEIKSWVVYHRVFRIYFSYVKSPISFVRNSLANDQNNISLKNRLST